MSPSVIRMDWAFAQAQRQFREYTNQVLQEHGLASNTWAILALLHEQGPLQAKQIAVKLDFAPPYITSLIAQLTKKALVSVSANGSDARAKLIELTDMADNLVPQLESKLVKAYGKMLETVSIEDLETFFRTVQLIQYRPV